MATYYEYKYHESNYTPLHIIKTPASNIKLRNFFKEEGDTKRLSNADCLGVNGCWFECNGDKSLNNIAVQDGVPIGTPTENGTNPTGATQWNCGRGVIAWDGYWVISKHDEDAFADIVGDFAKEGTWAQGGVALRLGRADWRTWAEQQYNPQNASGEYYYYDEEDHRTAMVADHSNCKIYLIVADEKVTPAVFRAAIEEYLGITDGEDDDPVFRGIMLDGGNSSQMAVVRNVNGGNVKCIFPSSNLLKRKLAQVVVLKNT